MAIEEIRRIVVTHAHPDHLGLAEMLKDVSGARVYLHARECAKLQGDWDNYDRTRLAFLAEAGVPDGLMVSFASDAKLGRSQMGRIVDLEPVEDGHTFEFDDLALEVIHTPGHSSGHICLYDRESGVIFSGDHLLKDISPNPMIEPSEDGEGGRTRSLEDYLRSLERLRDMDVSVAMTAHGEPIHDVRAKIDELFEHHRNRAEAIYQHLDEQGKTAFSLSEKLFPHVTGFEVLLAVSEIIAHMDLLMGQGRAACMRSNGVFLYYRLDGATSRSAR